ncbi:MAG: hypothetical protein WBG95_12530 [Sulfitobacter sp.]
MQTFAALAKKTNEKGSLQLFAAGYTDDGSADEADLTIRAADVCFSKAA